MALALSLGMSRRQRPRGNGGFTLVEVLVSLAILISALVAIANLFAVGLYANLTARSDSYATILAVQKLEELSAETALLPSPPDSLIRDAPGFAEYLTAEGKPVALSSDPTSGSVFVRRWSIRLSESAPGQTVVLEVFVRKAPRPSGSTVPAPSSGRGVHLVTIRRRHQS